MSVLPFPRWCLGVSGASGSEFGFTRVIIGVTSFRVLISLLLTSRVINTLTGVTLIITLVNYNLLTTSPGPLSSSRPGQK